MAISELQQIERIPADFLENRRSVGCRQDPGAALETGNNFRRSQQLNESFERTRRAPSSLFTGGPGEGSSPFFRAHPSPRTDKVIHAGAVETAFQHLLTDTARAHGWMLVPKLSVQRGGNSASRLATRHRASGNLGDLVRCPCHHLVPWAAFQFSQARCL
jgi:hypothetical protein